MPVSGLRRVAMEYALSNGDRAVNTFHVRLVPSSPFTESEAADIKDQFLAFAEGLDTYLATVVELDKIKVRDVSGPSGTGTEYEYDVSVPGLDATHPLPYQTALVASMRTALNSRRGRGRVYLCGFAEGNNSSNGEPASAMRTAIAGLLVVLQGALAAGGHELGVYSRTGDVFNEVTSFSIDGHWDTQRRRANRR